MNRFHTLPVRWRLALMHHGGHDICSPVLVEVSYADEVIDGLDIGIHYVLEPLRRPVAWRLKPGNPVTGCRRFRGRHDDVGTPVAINIADDNVHVRPDPTTGEYMLGPFFLTAAWIL